MLGLDWIVLCEHQSKYTNTYALALGDHCWEAILIEKYCAVSFFILFHWQFSQRYHQYDQCFLLSCIGQQHCLGTAVLCLHQLHCVVLHWFHGGGGLEVWVDGGHLR